MLNAHIDYDADLVAAENDYQARMAWEEINSMDAEPIYASGPVCLQDEELNAYGDTMSF